MSKSIKRKKPAVDLVIMLEDRPENKWKPVTHIAGIIQDTPTIPLPRATGIIREVLAAVFDNLENFEMARKLKICEDVSYRGIIEHSVKQACRIKEFAQKKVQTK
jgi:hypothetical protein